MSNKQTNTDIADTQFVHAAAALLSRVDGKMKGTLNNILQECEYGDNLDAAEATLVSSIILSGLSDEQTRPINMLFETMSTDEFGNLPKDVRDRVEHEFGLVKEAVNMFAEFNEADIYPDSTVKH